MHKPLPNNAINIAGTEAGNQSWCIKMKQINKGNAINLCNSYTVEKYSTIWKYIKCRKTVYMGMQMPHRHRSDEQTAKVNAVWQSNFKAPLIINVDNV